MNPVYGKAIAPGEVVVAFYAIPVYGNKVTH